MVSLDGRPGSGSSTWQVPVPRPRRIGMATPWRGPVPDPDADPFGARSLQVATARYVGGLALVAVLIQRFSTFVLPDIALLLPVVVGWGVWGMLRGIVVVERSRLLLWLAAAGACAIVVPLQGRLVDHPLISANAYLLIVTVWLPGVLQLKDRRRATYVLALRYIAYSAAFLAGLCVLFMVVQVAGVPYTDLMAQAFPSRLLLKGFVITYPITYGSPLFRSNGWIGLEPSVVSIMQGVGLIAALLSGVRLRIIVLLAAGMACSTAGSGLAIVLVAFVVMLGYPVRRNLVRYLPVAVIGALVLFITPFGQAILQRATEGNAQNSSTSLRSIQPYQYMWPQWIVDPMAVLFGRGPGSSQNIIDKSGITGLLAPTPIKIFFEYGVIAGVLLAALLLYAYVGGPSRSLPVTLLASLWLLQPGTTTIVVVLPLFLVSTWWSPRFAPVLESDLSTYATARGWLRRAARWRPFQGVGTWRVGRRRGPGSVQRSPGSVQRGPGSVQRGPGSVQRGPGSAGRGGGSAARGGGSGRQGPGSARRPGDGRMRP